MIHKIMKALLDSQSLCDFCGKEEKDKWNKAEGGSPDFEPEAPRSLTTGPEDASHGG